ncbi:MAG: hypothetical protein J7514_16275, partial [Acinetobacter oleivorans]|nr:hypothetical protein [Acinetobacter oleivorans]
MKWLVISNKEMENSLLGIGFSPQAAKGLVDVNAGRVNSVLYEDYNRNKPTLGKIKLKDFAKEFATVYN